MELKDNTGVCPLFNPPHRQKEKMPQLICENLTLGYNSQTIINDLSFSVNKGDYLYILGENGSGKSTITQFFETVGTYTNADEVVKTTGMSVIDAAKFVDENVSLNINFNLTSDLLKNLLR